jgi:hypothetical protein
MIGTDALTKQNATMVSFYLRLLGKLTPWIAVGVIPDCRGGF